MSLELESAASTARQLANELFSQEVAVCVNQQKDGDLSCIQQEGRRALTRPEKARGWARRPFPYYDADRLCRSCRAYFYAELAAQTVHEMMCCAIREEAMAKLKERS